jgi:hypothetical protein
MVLLLKPKHSQGDKDTRNSEFPHPPFNAKTQRRQDAKRRKTKESDLARQAASPSRFPGHDASVRLYVV